MEPFTFSLLVVAVFQWLKNGSEDIIHAAKGTESPRQKRATARLAKGKPGAGRMVGEAAASRLASWLDPAARPAKPPKPPRPGQGAARQFVSGWWADAWDDARERRVRKRHEREHPDPADPSPYEWWDEPDPEPWPEAKSDPEPWPEAKSDREPRPEAKSDPEPEPDPEPKPDREPGPEAKSDPEPEPRFEEPAAPEDDRPETVSAEAERLDSDKPLEFGPGSSPEAGADDNEPIDAEIVDDDESVPEPRSEEGAPEGTAAGATAGGTVSSADGLDPATAIAFVMEVSRTADAIRTQTEQSVSNLAERKVKGAPLDHLQSVAEACVAQAEYARQALAFFQRHLAEQELIKSNATVGGARYLGIGAR